MSREEEKPIKRREFLRETAAAAAVLSLGLGCRRTGEGGAESPAAAAPFTGEPVTFGIIGTGTQGSRILERALRVPGTRCAAVCDVYPRNQKRGLEIARKAEPYTDYHKLLERKDIQAVLIATPLSLHARMALDALDAGKHVYVEKTMAYSLEECREMVRRTRGSKLRLQVGQQRRYGHLAHHALEQVRKGGIGKVTAVRAFWNRNGSWRRGLPPEDRAQWDRLLNWRIYKEYSGGLMTELGCHHLDTINWFLGARPVSVMGVGGLDWYKDGRDTWDNVHVIYEYPGGVKVTYQSLCTSAYDGEGCVFLGTKGALVITATDAHLFREQHTDELLDVLRHAKKETDAQGRTTVVLDASATTKADKRERSAGVKLAAGDGQKKGQDDYLMEMLDFFEVVRTGKKPFVDAAVGMETAATVLRANEAMEKQITYRFKKEDFEA